MSIVSEFHLQINLPLNGLSRLDFYVFFREVNHLIIYDLHAHFHIYDPRVKWVPLDRVFHQACKYIRQPCLVTLEPQRNFVKIEYSHRDFVEFVICFRGDLTNEGCQFEFLVFLGKRVVLDVD